MKLNSKLKNICAKSLLASLGCVAVLAPLTMAHAQKPEAVPAKPLTVLAMIKAENDVLAQWQAKQRKVSARARPKPALLAIYGVMPQLRATVMVNGHEVVFEQGRREPLQPQASTLRLRQIKPPCVSFTQGARLERVCLSRARS